MPNKTAKREIITSALKKVKLYDAGRKMSNTGMPVKSSKNEMYYPSLHLDTKQAPDLKGKEVEDIVTLVIQGKIVSHSVDENERKSDESFRIDIGKIGLMSSKE